MEIIVGKKYVTQGGDIVLITDNHFSDSEYPILGVIGEAELNWTTHGKYYDNSDESDYDLVREYIAKPEPFVMDARATMAMHFVASLINSDSITDWTGNDYVRVSVEYADLLIAELTKGKME